MKTLIEMAQDLQKLSYKEYPGIGVPFLKPLIQLMRNQDEIKVREFIYENNQMLSLYPAIYRYLKKEIKEMPDYDYLF